MAFLTFLGDAIWNPWLLCLFLFTGLWYSVRTGFFQLFGLPVWLRETVGKFLHPPSAKRQGGLTQFQALSTALASTIGTGSIAGVATAIFFGGPGAVLWMWISAFLGMMTGCAEKILAIRYRERAKGGGFQGGPMVYISRGLGKRWMGCWFALSCVGASLLGGNLVQANSISTALEAALGWDRLWVGIVVAVCCALETAGGVGQIGRFSESLVPAMALLFLGGSGVVLLHNADALPAAFRAIFTGGLTPRAMVSGTAGYGIASAMRYGVARGVFTNEAGMGSSAIAHAAADVEHPAEEGMWGILEVFVATILVCTMTALVILTAGVYDPAAALWSMASGQVTDNMLGAPLSAASYGAVLGRGGVLLVAVSLLLFAFTSLVGWSYYGERSLAFLAGEGKGKRLYRLLFLGAIAVGSVVDLQAVWELADIWTGLMALPNLVALLLLTPEVLSALRGWKKEKVEG